MICVLCHILAVVMAIMACLGLLLWVDAKN